MLIRQAPSGIFALTFMKPLLTSVGTANRYPGDLINYLPNDKI